MGTFLNRALTIGAVWVTLLGHAVPASGDGCARRFDVMTTGLPAACIFIGQISALGASQIVATFAGDGVVLVVSLVVDSGAPQLFFPARVVTDTTAELVRWRSDLNLADADLRGSVRLDSHGELLLVRFDSDRGSTLEFRGRFAGMASVPTTYAAAAPVR